MESKVSSRILIGNFVYLTRWHLLSSFIRANQNSDTNWPKISYRYSQARPSALKRGRSERGRVGHFGYIGQPFPQKTPKHSLSALKFWGGQKKWWCICTGCTGQMGALGYSTIPFHIDFYTFLLNYTFFLRFLTHCHQQHWH